MIRRIDELGRLVIPKEWRTDAGLVNGGFAVMKYNEETKEVIITSYDRPVKCTFCGAGDPLNLKEFKQGIICNECLEIIKKPIEEEK